MPLLEKIMRQRGFDAEFLTPKYGEFADLPDMDKAVGRIAQAVSDGEKVIIYGDYDADGVTASTVMRDALELAGVREVEVMLPDRFKDGYGMSRRLVERAKEVGAGLVVTVDCGSSNGEIVDELNALGVDVVVTDHHECLGELPKAVAVVNPKRRDVAVAEEMQCLAGVGVAFMVAYGLMRAGLIPEGQEKWLLDMVLIGTVCDSMLMTGANRILCYYGAKVVAKTRRVGLVELMRRAGVKTINSEAIGFQIGPRINAAGRMQSAELAFNLLNTKSRAEAARLAEELETLNSARKNEQMRAAQEIAERGVGEEKVLVEVGDWHEGVLGIIAGRLVEDYRRPAFVLSEVDGVMKGSGRSFGEFNLAEALSECQSCLVAGGGHAGACGLKLLPEQVDNFRTMVNKYYDDLNLTGQEKYLEVAEDLTLTDLSEVSVEEIEELAQLEPYGEGNSEPVMLLANMEVAEVRKMGAEGQHLKLTLRDKQGRTVPVMAFFAPEEWLKIEPTQKVSVKAHLEINEWQGAKSPEGRIISILT